MVEGASARRSVDDPLGPVDQPPDVARDLACDLTASDLECSPPTVPDRPPPEFDPPSDLAGGAGSGIGTLLVVLLVVALVVALAWIAYAVLRNRNAIETDDVDELDEALDDELVERVVDHERPPDRWRRAAADHRAAGRYRDAIRCEYRALVGDLARSGHVDEIPGRTSGEERAQVNVLAPEVAPAFSAAADIFDSAWFDDAEVTVDDDRAFVAAAAIVVDDVLVGSGSGRLRR